MKNKNLIERIRNRIYIKIITPLVEKKFYLNGVILKYLLFKNIESDVLIIGFQACHKRGARYNYIGTLKDFKVNKLFIKDDFATNHRGNYYIGENGKYNIELQVNMLINKTIKQLNVKKIIFIGSSKGAYAAVNFGIEYPKSYMVIAAPQYYLGDYLNTDYQKENLENIVGKPITNEKIKKLNYRLKSKIANDKVGDTQQIFIQYSKDEHTYNEHICDMIEDLKDSRIKVNENIQEYKIHGELKYYYPQYLKECINRIINEKLNN